MTREEFLRLAAAGYNRIPLARETLADFDTPCRSTSNWLTKPTRTCSSPCRAARSGAVIR